MSKWLPQLFLMMALAVPVAAAPQASRTARQAAARPLPLTVLVTGPGGAAQAGVKVTVEGPVPREGVTGDDGIVRLANMRPGTYRLRFQHEAFLTFEREVTLRAGQPSAIDVTLTPAPPKPAAAPPPPAKPSAMDAPPGEAKTLSIPDFVEKNLIGREPMKESVIGCSGTATTTVLQLREPLQDRVNEDVEETLYVVAGEGTIRLGGRDQALEPGMLAIVPRGTTHSLSTRRNGRLILLSTRSGQPCTGSAPQAGK